MRTTFTVGPQGQLCSAVRPRAEPHALSVSSRIVFSQPYSAVEYNGVAIPKGAVGYVDFIDEEYGTVWVHMRGKQPGLGRWDDHIAINPFTSEELLRCLRVSSG